jgi:hypothetical protein
MDRLEELLRASLSERADDVEPTPVLWDRVQRRITRRRWLTATAWVAGGAAAALAAATVLPSVLSSDVQPDIADRPPSAVVSPQDDATPTPGGPTPAPTSPAPSQADPTTGDRDGDLVPDTYVAVEGRQRLTLRASATDELMRELSPEVPVEGEAVITALAIHPDSTADDLTVALTIVGEGMEDVRLWRVTPEGREVRQLWTGPARAPRAGAAVEAVDGLVWAEDGSALVWNTVDGLRIATYDAMLAVTPDDPAVVGDVGRVYDDVGSPDLEPRDWVLLDGFDGAPGDLSVIHLSDGQQHVTVRLERTTEGYEVDTVQAEASQDRYGVVDSHLTPGAAVGPSYGLRSDGGQLRLSFGADGDVFGPMPLGGNLIAIDEAWLSAYGRAVVVGKSDGVWLSVRDGGARALPEDVRIAALVPFPPPRD